MPTLVLCLLMSYREFPGVKVDYLTIWSISKVIIGAHNYSTSRLLQKCSTDVKEELSFNPHLG